MHSVSTSSSGRSAFAVLQLLGDADQIASDVADSAKISALVFCKLRATSVMQVDLRVSYSFASHQVVV